MSTNVVSNQIMTNDSGDGVDTLCSTSIVI
jgi:hypothetical protein